MFSILREAFSRDNPLAPTNQPTTYGNQRARQGHTSIAKLNRHTGQPHSRVWAVARRRRRI